MELNRVVLWGSLVLALWLLPGCGKSSSSAPSVWGGTQLVFKDSAELADVRWTRFPTWGELAKLPGKSKIKIEGKWQMAGDPAPVPFQCLLDRQSGSTYRVSFRLNHGAGQRLIAAGDVDWARRSSALDFQGDFSAEQYREYFGILPELKKGSVEVRGSALWVGDRTSFPALVISPAGNSVLQMGPFPLTGGKIERRETFSGKIEYEASGMTVFAGGIKLYPSEISTDSQKAFLKFVVEPASPWQSSVALRGEGECALSEDGAWSVRAELPEAGVFRKEALILPLRRCLLQGNGNTQGGKWIFDGEGASATYLNTSGTATAANIRLNGECPFFFSEEKAPFMPESVSLSCGKLEIPHMSGRIEFSQYRGTYQLQQAGGRLYSGQARRVTWEQPGGGALLLISPEWHLPMLHAGDKWFSAERGELRAEKMQLTNPQWQAAAEKITCALVLKAQSWELDLVPETLQISTKGISSVLQGGNFQIRGSHKDGGSRVAISGAGTGMVFQAAGVQGACREWRLNSGLSADFASCSLFSLSGKSWHGKFGGTGNWTAEKITLECTPGKREQWSGQIALAGGSFSSPELAGTGVFVQLPFGGADVAGCKIKAEQIRYKQMAFDGVMLDLQNAPDGVTLRGRGKYALTGGACFVTGDIRQDWKQGNLEYSVPAATLTKEWNAADILPLAGGWHFSGKMGESGRIHWQNGLPEWRRKCTFSGFARNGHCMIEDISGQVEPVNGEIADGRLLFRRLTSVAGEGSEGEVLFRTEKKNIILQEARFNAWGGQWKWIQNGEFQVKGIDLSGLLPLADWPKAVSGKFSGSLTLDDQFSVLRGDLKSDTAGKLALAGLEKYRLLPKTDLDTNLLSFTTAAFRDFQFRTLSLRIVGRKNSVLLRFSGEGRPVKPIPFVLEKDGLFRPAVGNELGFDGNVEIGCGYRIPVSDFRKMH